MESAEVANALRRLKTGKYVDIYCDPGEEVTAQGIMDKLAVLGLRCELYDVHRSHSFGARLPSWFIKYVVGGFVGLSVLWLALFRIWPESEALRVLTIILVLFLFSVPWTYVVWGSHVMTEEARQRVERSVRWLAIWCVVLLLLLLITIQEPWLGIVLLAIGLGGVGCAVVIRLINRRPSV